MSSPQPLDSEVSSAGPALLARLRGLIFRADTRDTIAVERDLLEEVARVVAAHERLAERFEESVAEARLAALRELAYGAGHEINNPLANIAARAQALLLDERDPERRRRLATIVDQAFRARDMIGGLMLFARPPKPEPDDTSSEELLQPVLASCQSQAEARRIRFEYTPPAKPLRLRIDPVQVGEALRLLTLNAFEAAPEGGHVRLTVGADDGRQTGRICVFDNGSGMDVETAERACDPFFSGREAGRGIGLGLPKALRLVEASGGRLQIASEPAGGTQCTLILPLAGCSG
jgi:signal transduction histidine kinase